MGTAINVAKATELRDWGSASGNSETGRIKACILGCKLRVPRLVPGAHYMDFVGVPTSKIVCYINIVVTEILKYI